MDDNRGIKALDERAPTQLQENRWALFSHEDRDRLKQAIEECSTDEPYGMTEKRKTDFLREMETINERHRDAWRG